MGSLPLPSPLRRASLLVTGLLVLVAGYGASVGAEDPGVLDLAPVAERVAAGIEAGPTGKAARTYGKLERLLGRESRRGLKDDFRKLGAVSGACAGVLSGDAALIASLREALDEGEAVLGARAVELLEAADRLEDGGPRTKVLRTLAKARALAADASTRREGGDEGEAIRSMGKAAAGFDRTEKGVARARTKLARGAPLFRTPLAGLGPSLLGVWGETGPDPAIYTVGADYGSGPPFLVLTPGAEAWVRVPVAPSGDLWWVAGVPGAGVWMSGSEGAVNRYDPATGSVEDLSTGVDAILYGLWGTGPSDVWAVGGDPFGVGPRPVILHHDGEGWSSVPVPAAAEGKMLYKVWGTAANDAWICGQAGVVLHWDGADWTPVSSGTNSTLLTVHGIAPTVAVGGGGVAAVLVERDASDTWAAVTTGQGGSGGGGGQQLIPSTTPSLNGVFVRPGGEALAVGFERTVAVRTARKGWNLLPGVPAGVADFHAVWSDEEGNAVLVGGDLFTLTDGGMVTWGRRVLPAAILDQARLREDVQPVLFTGCATSGCHLAPFDNLGLELSTAENTLASTVAVPSAESPLLRISRGLPSRSYLFRKLEGTHLDAEGSGDRMPQGGPYLDAAAMDLVRAWILEGALDN